LCNSTGEELPGSGGPNRANDASQVKRMLDRLKMNCTFSIDLLYNIMYH